MVRVQGTLQSSEPTGPLPLHAIFLRAQPKSELFSNAAAEPDVSHHSLPKCLGLKSGFDRTTGRSAEENRLSASVPTLTPFDFQYNKSGFSVSSATLLLLTQILVCCIDRLNPQHIPAIHQVPYWCTKYKIKNQNRSANDSKLKGLSVSNKFTDSPCGLVPTSNRNHDNPVPRFVRTGEPTTTRKLNVHCWQK